MALPWSRLEADLESVWNWVVWVLIASSHANAAPHTPATYSAGLSRRWLGLGLRFWEAAVPLPQAAARMASTTATPTKAPGNRRSNTFLPFPKSDRSMLDVLEIELGATRLPPEREVPAAGRGDVDTVGVDLARPGIRGPGLGEHRGG